MVGREAGLDKELKDVCGGRVFWEMEIPEEDNSGPCRACGCVEDVGLYPKSRGKLLKDGSSVGLE